MMMIFAVVQKGGKMAEYHVGCGAFDIYAGTLEPRNKSLWRNKSNVTHEALCAVAQYLLDGEKEFGFQYKGEWYVMKIERQEE